MTNIQTEFGPTKGPFGPEELKARSRDLYVGNESDTDEYRETEPAKLLSLIGSVAQEMPGDKLQEMVDLMAPWIATVHENGGCADYAGAEEAAAIFALIHDHMWDNGEQPYYDTIEDLK